MAGEVAEIREQFAEAKKTFDSTVTATAQKAPIPKDKMNFFLMQMDSINGRLESLEKTVEIGIPLVEAESGVARLTALEHALQDNQSKMNLIATNIRDIKKDMELIKKEIRGGISSAVIDNLKTRVNYLENLIKQYSGSKTHKILMELVEIVQGLDKHVSNIENFIDRDLQGYLDLKGLSPQELENLDFQQAAKKQQAAQPKVKQGNFIEKIVEKIKSFF